MESNNLILLITKWADKYGVEHSTTEITDSKGRKAYYQECTYDGRDKVPLSVMGKDFASCINSLAVLISDNCLYFGWFTSVKVPILRCNR